MKALRLFSKVMGCLALCVVITRADSIQLRNGRRLHGKYVGGTTTAVGFMTAGSVEYFATSEVLMLMFDGANDAPGQEWPPSPMNGSSLEQPARIMPILQVGPPLPDTSASCTPEKRDKAFDREWLTEMQDLMWLWGNNEYPLAATGSDFIQARLACNLVTDRGTNVEQNSTERNVPDRHGRA